MFEFPARLNLSRAHQGISRVSVFSEGRQLDNNAPIIDGSVSEKDALGIRRSLSLTVEPSAQWLKWFQLPKLELVIYAGYSWGMSEWLSPMGVYPVLPPQQSFPRKTISINADDRWQYVQMDGFLRTFPSYQGLAIDVAARLIDEVGILIPTDTSGVSLDRITTVPTMIWGKPDSRHDTIKSVLEPIAATAFITRYGHPVIRASYVRDTGRPLTDGENGTIISVSTTQDRSKVYNQISVTSSKQGVTFDPVPVVIDDPNHPAHAWRIGRRSVPGGYSSPLIDTPAQAAAVGRAMLEKASAPALGWSVECIPDYSREAGDLVQVTTSDLGTVNATIAEITHPLGEGKQTMKLGAAL